MAKTGGCEAVSTEMRRSVLGRFDLQFRYLRYAIASDATCARRLEASKTTSVAPCNGGGMQSGARIDTALARRRYLGNRRRRRRRHPNIDHATPLRGQRVAVVSAARRRQSRI